MTITKFPQSCLKIERGGGAIIFDIGIIATAKFGLDDFGKLDAVIYTHRHVDHLDLQMAKQINQAGIAIYGNQDVSDAIGGNIVEVVEEDEELVVAGIRLKAVDLPHCLLVDGSTTVPNTGFIVDDSLLIPGDSTETRGIKVKLAALPIFGPDISFKDTYQMAVDLEAERVIPIHYDIAKMDPHTFELLGGDFNDQFKVQVLEDSESTQLT